jgi:hypothetical protein
MGKTGLVVPLLRRKDFLFRFWGTFLTVLALPSAVLTILGRHISPKLTACLVFFGLLFAVILNRRLLRVKSLPPELLFGSLDGTRLRCPSDLKLSEQVGGLAQDCYRGESISPDKYETLRVKNPFILACLTGPQGDFLGYFDVIPLKEHFATLFIQGRVTEKDLTHEDVFSPNEIHLCKHLYISGLAVCNSHTFAGYKNSIILVWGLLKYLDHFYGKANLFTFAIAFTDEGEVLLRNFKLPIFGDHSTRLDKHPVYALILSHDEIANRLACLPDYSALCSLDWEESVRPASVPTSSSPVSVPRHRRVALPARNRHSLQSATSNIARRR